MTEALDFNSKATKASAFSNAFTAILDGSMEAKRAKQERRQYLGASAIGGDCERAIQFEFAGAPRERDFKPDTLRKFDLGHCGEEVLRAWLCDAGFKLVQHNQRTGSLFSFSQLDGRFKGHPDGVFVDGPDLLKYPALWETKSTGAKTYREIERNGLKKARPGYYAQVAIYQAYLGLTENPAVFTVLNLDSGEVGVHLISFDAQVAQEMSDRAVRIVTATDAGELLPRPFASSDDYRCRMCSFAARCWSQPA